MVVVRDAAAGMVIRFVVACGGCGDVGGVPHLSMVVIPKVFVPGIKHSYGLVVIATLYFV